MGKQTDLIEGNISKALLVFAVLAALIAAIGGMRIRTTADLVNAFRRERLANQVLMQIVRDGRPYYARMLLQ